jgi:hypothetical protein
LGSELVVGKWATGDGAQKNHSFKWPQGGLHPYLRGTLSKNNYIYCVGKSQHRHLTTYQKGPNGPVRVFTSLCQNPGWVSGFIDAEGSFRISVKRSNNKWVISAMVQINLHSKDLSLLESIQEYFNGAGYIGQDSKRNVAYYVITKFDDLINIVIPHFKSYPLQSYKSIDYALWVKCVKLMKIKKHLTLMSR